MLDLTGVFKVRTAIRGEPVKLAQYLGVRKGSTSYLLYDGVKRWASETG